MNNLIAGLTEFFAGFSPIMWGGVFGALLTGILAWVGSVVTHSGNRATRKLSRLEKRAVLDVRNFRKGASGSEVTGDIVNFGVTAAHRVTLIIGGGTVYRAALGAGESVTFEVSIPIQVNDLEVDLIYYDFFGTKHRCMMLAKIDQVSVALREVPHRRRLWW